MKSISSNEILERVQQLDGKIPDQEYKEVCRLVLALIHEEVKMRILMNKLHDINTKPSSKKMRMKYYFNWLKRIICKFSLNSK